MVFGFCHTATVKKETLRQSSNSAAELMKVVGVVEETVQQSLALLAQLLSEWLVSHTFQRRQWMNVQPQHTFIRRGGPQNFRSTCWSWTNRNENSQVRGRNFSAASKELTNCFGSFAALNAGLDAFTHPTSICTKVFVISPRQPRRVPLHSPIMPTRLNFCFGCFF